MDKFLADVDRIYKEKGNCMVAVSEGILYADGSFVSEAKTSATDGFGHAQLGGLAAHLYSIASEAAIIFSSSIVSTGVYFPTRDSMTSETDFLYSTSEI